MSKPHPSSVRGGNASSAKAKAMLLAFHAHYHPGASLSYHNDHPGRPIGFFSSDWDHRPLDQRHRRKPW